MKPTKLLFTSFLAALVLTTSGCFRVSSDTRALRDAALESGFGVAEEKIEVGVGFFTVGLAKLATKFIDIPPEARLALSSLKNAECALYQVKQRHVSLAAILTRADEAMLARGCERLVGVIEDNQLVAVYVPRQGSPKYLEASVLVLTGDQLVCATAEANASDLIELAMSKVHEKHGMELLARRE
jgi:hypothetical protein